LFAKPPPFQRFNFTTSDYQQGTEKQGKKKNNGNRDKGQDQNGIRCNHFLRFTAYSVYHFRQAGFYFSEIH